ncbi:Vinac1 [Phodopus roborovskii]|uniref:Vinac1 protein n=1 Tax=Phodopus roborovskii TaxID=109678 RepID=A0AAU9Z775_PHORO|nr:Vinac1 [Phodopus roborovskii]
MSTSLSLWCCDFCSQTLEMESFLWDDFGPLIQNRAMEQIITPMTIQLCHLLISVERKDVQKEALASVQKAAEDLANASAEFVHVASRLAGDSEEEWLREEMQPVAESLMLSGRNILMVIQKLPLQPECQRHWEELVIAAQQILVDTTKVLLLEDRAMARKTVLAAGWCLTFLEALEAVEDAPSLRASIADLASALLRLGGLTTRWARDERLGRVRHRLGCCIPALLAAARGHLRHPTDPQVVASRRRVITLTRQSLGELLAVLQPRVSEHGARSQNGALARCLQKLRQVLEEPGPSHLRGGLLDAPLATVVWHCLRLAACSAPQERMHLVYHCRQLLQLRSRVHRPPQPIPGTECIALRAATDTLCREVRAGLLRQILDTFTDTQSPLERLVQAALATSTIRSRCNSESLAETLQLLLDAFHNQAKQMIRVAHLVWVFCPQQQTGRDVEAAVAGLWGLVVKAKELFSQSPQTHGLDWSPVTLQTLLEAWARESQHLLACFDVVLDIPEFLSLSIQEMTNHLDLYTSGASREFSESVAFLCGRATHVVQVMSRYVGQDPDPIFRNGMRVVVHQLAQSSLTLAAATEGGDSTQDTGTFVTMAKHLIYSAQQVHEGLDGTNHPDILSPLRFQVQRFDIAKGWPYFILPSFQHPTMKSQLVPELGESGTNTSFLAVEQLYYTVVPSTCKRGCGSPSLAVSEIISAAESRDHQVVTSSGTNRPEQESTMNTAQEIQAGEEPLWPGRMTRLHEFSTVVPLITDLAREEVHSTNTRRDSLLEMAFQQSGRTREARQALVARAGDWYPLCQQLFYHNLTAELPGSMAAFVELQQNLASMVQVAAKSGPVNLKEKSPDPIGHPGMLFELQGMLEKAEIHAKQLLDQAVSSDSLQAPWSREENVDNECLLWAVAVQDLMQCMGRLSRRQGLFLLPLKQAVKNQQGLQEGLDQATDVSQRLQDAAALSSALCADEQVKGEVSFLCGEVHVLTDALLEVAHILVSSSKPCPSLSTRFELLCLELSLQAKALTSYLSSINTVYEDMFQDVDKSSPARMLSVIQTVQGIIAGGQESASFQEDLLVSLESILMLTKEVAERVPVQQEHPENQELHMLDWLRWEWAAKAHHAVTQLQALEGGHTEAWRLLVQCLKPREEPAKALEEDPVQLQPHCKEGAAGTTAGDSIDSQDAVPKGTLEGPMGTCADEQATTRTTTVDMSMSGIPSLPPAQMDQTVPEDGCTDGENRITQITQKMAKEVLLMAQSLRKRGRILTKDQLIASARRISASGKDIARLIQIIAKNCIDQRCSQELLCMVEQIQTLSSQLSIISSVKASLERSKASEELLVDNAQRLLQAVSKTVQAAEAACLRGLRWLSSDPEELEVATLCTQWKRKLLQHRLQEASNEDCDELGLRKTSTRNLPALAAL